MQIGSSVDIHAVWNKFVGDVVLIHCVIVCCLGEEGPVLANECQSRVSHMHTRSAEGLTIIFAITVPTGECSVTFNL